MPHNLLGFYMTVNNKIPVYVSLVIISLMAFYFKDIKGYLGAKKFDYLVTRPNERRLTASFEYLDKQLKEANLHSLNDTVDFIRNFIHHNSIHLIDEEHGHYAGNTNLILNWTIDVAQHTRDEKPHLSCGPRADILKKMLTWYGIRNRIVQIYSDEYDDVRSHTFAEVYNPLYKTWHIQDADFNIYYQNAKGERVDIATLVFENQPDSILPVSGKKIGWEQNNLVFLKEKYFESMRIGNVVLINPNRFNLRKIFPQNNGITGQQFFDTFNLQCLEINALRCMR